MQNWVLIFFLLPVSLCAQKVSVKPRFDPGKAVIIDMDIKNSITQQAGAQAIDFQVSGSLTHRYTITDVSDAGVRLHHELNRLGFQFQGMGKKRSFDSDSSVNASDPFGLVFKEILSRQYDMIIDPAGKVIKAIPEKISLAKQDETLVLITDMLKDLTNVVYPPKKGDASFFAVLPQYETGPGDSWTDSTNSENEKSVTVNTLSSVTDSTIVVDFKSTSVTIFRSERKGMPATTRLNNTTTGTVILDKTTGIIREKTSLTDFHGTMEAMNTTLPVTGKTSMTIRVRK